jgi:hypothetical protein
MEFTVDFLYGNALTIFHPQSPLREKNEIHTHMQHQFIRSFTPINNSILALWTEPPQQLPDVDVSRL